MIPEPGYRPALFAAPAAGTLDLPLAFPGVLP